MAARKSKDAPKAPEAPQAGASTTEAPEAPQAGASTTEAPEAPKAPVIGDMVKVRPKRGRSFEPFQRLELAEGQATPVVYTNWVKSQCDAGILVLVTAEAE